jgi:ornithine carbamoyltransferase
MGQEGERDKIKHFEGFSIDRRLLSLAKDNAIVMHCLPAHKGEEISEEVFESFADVIFTQAENRLHAQKSLMSLLFNGELARRLGR